MRHFGNRQLSPLSDFLAGGSGGLPPVYMGGDGSITKDAFIALAYLDPGTITLGGSYSIDAKQVTVNAINLPDILVDLAMKGLAFFYMNGTVTGTKDAPQRLKLAEKFGTQAVEQETGEAIEKFTMKIKDYHRNIKHFNALARQSGKKDVILFTSNSFIWLSATGNQVTFTDMGHAVSGDAMKGIAGGSVVITAHNEKGEFEHNFGVLLAKLSSDRLKLTFGAPTLTNATVQSCTQGMDRYVRTAAGAITVKRAISQANAQCVTYAISQKMEGGTADVSAHVTINPVSGDVAVAAGITTGTYEFTVTAENSTGVYGVYSFRLVIA